MFSDILSELRRRNVLKAGGAYAAGAWAFFQIADALFLLVGAPGWVSRVLMILLVLGLPFLLAFAWAFELTPEGLKRTEEVDPAQSQTRETGRRIQYLMIGLLSVAVVVLAADRFIGSEPRAGASSEAASAQIAGLPNAPQDDALAVMPFRTSGPETDVWREGMMSMLTTNLDGLGRLQAVDTRTVLARFREQVPPGTDADLATTLAAARNAQASMALVGDVVAVGETMQIAASLYDTESGDVLGRLRTEGAADDFMALIDRLTVQAVEAARTGEADGDALPVPDVSALTTESLPALRAYLRGEDLYRQSRYRDALRQFERAVEIDSTFAMANLRLVIAGESVGVTDPTDPDAPQARRVDLRNHLLQAQRHGGRLPPRETALLESAVAYIVDFDVPETIDALRRGAERHPTDPELWYQFGETQALQPVAMPTQQPDARQEGLQALRHALSLDSTLTPAYRPLIWSAISSGDTAEARRLLAAFDRHDGQDEDTRLAQTMRAALDLAYGDSIAQAAVTRQLRGGAFPGGGVRVLDALIWNPSADAIQAQIRFGEAIVDRFETYGLLKIGWRHSGQYARLRAFVQDATLPTSAQESRMAAATTLLGRGEMAITDVPANLFASQGCSMDAPPQARVFACYCTAWLNRYRQHAGLPGPHAERIREARTVLTETLPELTTDRTLKQAMSGVLGLLDGLDLLEASDPAAHDTLDAAHRRAVPLVQYNSNWHAMEQQVRALVEAGDPERALPYAATIATHDPYGHYLAGRAHEALGDADAARTAYQRFVSAWRDADADISALRYARGVLDGTASPEAPPL